MDEVDQGSKDQERRQRLLGRLDRMVESGRVTEEESDSLRTANSNEDFDEVVRHIRVRHATAGLSAAVEDGDMTAEEADRAVERLRSGEHPTGLRANLRRHRSGTRRGSS
jgi:polyhydroxyalkanoate synthesis regulator phasin